MDNGRLSRMNSNVLERVIALDEQSKGITCVRYHDPLDIELAEYDRMTCQADQTIRERAPVGPDRAARLAARPDAAERIAAAEAKRERRAMKRAKLSKEPRMLFDGSSTAAAELIEYMYPGHSIKEAEAARREFEEQIERMKVEGWKFTPCGALQLKPNEYEAVKLSAKVEAAKPGEVGILPHGFRIAIDDEQKETA
jgi:hypothetical protein